MDKGFRRIARKIKTLISEMHNKITKWLTTEYNAIHLPKLNFHSCKKLNKKSKAKLATFRHCGLFERIKEKARENQACNLYERNEAFTSKTCCNCGTIFKDLGNKDTYNCSKCNISLERDFNGAINIMLRYVSSYLK